jgi:hypothetical protein
VVATTATATATISLCDQHHSLPGNSFDNLFFSLRNLDSVHCLSMQLINGVFFSRKCVLGGIREGIYGSKKN